MKTKLIILFSFLCLTIIGSCKKDKDQQLQNVRKPGSFKLLEVKNSSKSVHKSAFDTNYVRFDFGDLKASKEFYLLLINSGDETIYDVHLSTDNPAFTVSPSVIDQIPGGFLISNESNTGLIQLISIGIIHGIQLNGVGYTDLLPMGINTSTLTVTGRTLHNKDTLVLKNTFSLSVNAKIMDIQLFDNLNEIDLTNPSGVVGPGLGGLGFLRRYTINTLDTISIRNIGNVPINLNYGSYNDLNNSMLIPVSSSVSVSITNLIGNLFYFELNSNGVITNNNRLQLGNDGNAYFALSKY